MKKIVLFLLILSLPSLVNAAVYKTGKVSSVKMFDDVVVIYVDTVTDNACGTGQKRVAVKNTDPIYDAVVSSAITAKVTQSTVEIGYHEACTNNPNSWDFESFWIK